MDEDFSNSPGWIEMDDDRGTRYFLLLLLNLKRLDKIDRWRKALWTFCIFSFGKSKRETFERIAVIVSRRGWMEQMVVNRLVFLER